MKSRQSGFTLVEIAIVLVIIGLLLGGVLKGQEMINNGKIKSIINDMRGVSSAYNAYQDRFRAIPGDDSAAATRFVGAVAGSGNGQITGAYGLVGAPAAGAAAESVNFWQHTRLAGFLSGPAALVAPATNLQPFSAVGGFIGVQDAVAPYGLGIGLKVCAGSVPSGFAQAIDTQVDDGVGTTGTFRAAAGAGANAAAGGGAVAAAYVAGATTIHTACWRLS